MTSDIYGKVAQQLLPKCHQKVSNLTHRLPPAVLGEIFIYWQHLHDNKWPRGPGSVLPARVCQQWRVVATATSKLWTYFRYHTPRSRIIANPDVEFEMTTTWLERSKGQPLRIHFVLSELEDTANRTAIDDPVLSLLKAQAHRWEDIIMHIAELPHPLLQSIPLELPMLRTLRVDNLHSFGSIFNYNFNSFRNAPSLRVLTLGHRISSPILDVHWENLTHFTLQSFEIRLENVTTFLLGV